MPSNSGAPKVTFKTLDISDVGINLSTSVGAIVIATNKGDVDKPTLISTKPKLIERYCHNKPAPTDIGIYAALGFLEQGNQLYVMRVHNGALYGGVEFKKSGSPYGSAPLSSGEVNPVLHSFGADGLILVYAANPGVWNEDIKIVITNIDTDEYTFDIKVYVDDADGVSTLQETWNVSRKTKIDGYGNQLYLETKINGYSQYIKVEDNLAEADTVLPKAATTAVAMTGGTDGSAVSTAQVIAGWDKFTNVTEYPVNILMSGGQTDIATLLKIAAVAEARQDAFAVLDMPLSVANSIVDTQSSWVNNNLSLNSSYAAIYSPWVQIFDEFNGQLLTVPPSGEAGAIMALTDRIYNSAHGAPALYNRGIIRRAVGISISETFDSGELDALTTAKINPIVRDPGYGTVVFEELTLQKKNSALKNIHVRRLINQIQAQSVITARKYLGEPLLPRTYFRVRTEFEQYFALLESLGAFDNNDDRGWRVVCDATNNSASDRDNDTLNLWLFIKPVKILRYLQIQAVITRSSANFNLIISAGV